MKALFILLTAPFLLSACQTATDKEIGLGEPTQHDDFFYAAKHVVVQDSIGSMKPKGRFWIVTFQVDNQAKRVEHPWTNTVAFVTDENKHVYENQPNAQQQLNQAQPFGWQKQYVTPAGRIDTTRIVFDLPTTLRQPYLQYRGELLMGDAFDGRQFEHTKVRLF